MALNTVPAVALLRQPRAMVQFNGSTVNGWEELTVDSNSFYTADTWSAKFAVSDLPPSNDIAWFSQQTETFVAIYMGFPTDPVTPDINELTQMIYGRIDTMEYDPVTTTMEVKGRDLTAVFIDSMITSDWANKRSSDVASQLASSHGLQANITATTTLIGTFYERDHVRMQANRSEWDLLTWLAREEGFVCYVSGQELYFGPDPQLNSDPYILKWQANVGTDGLSHPIANVIDLKLSRTQTVSKGVSVTVRSVNPNSKAAISQSYPKAAATIKAGQSSPFGNVQNYFFTLPPGHSPTDCEQYAEQKYHEIISHEMKLEATLPGDDILTPRVVLQLVGTGTQWDQTYFPRAVSRNFSLKDGFLMTVQAQNHSTDLSE